MFVHLHNHSDYSLLDGACRIPELIRIAKEQGAPAVGLTDHGNLFGALEFYTAAQEAGVKPLIGCELYLAPGSRLEKKPGRSGELRYHQVLFAKNETGYRNLCHLASEAYISGFYYKPRIDKELLSQFHEGLICLSSCLQGELPQLVLEGNIDAAREALRFYKSLFGDDFYIELQRHGLEEQNKILPHLVDLAQSERVKLVATNDAHYLERAHAVPHDILLCVGTQSKRDDPKRMRFDTQEFYLKTPEEMSLLFADLPEAVANTLEIAEKVDLSIDLKTRHYPVFSAPEGDEIHSPGQYLAELAREGFQRRYGDQPEAVQRLEAELAVIEQTGFSNYFLIVWDFVRWAKENGIPVGPGRGSAAGCIVAYCLGITNIDPLRYGLIFERFLNPERVSPPDIDIDFSDDRREDVITYVRDKYGKDSVCRITTFGRMAARSAVRDVARALGLSFAEGDRIARLIPEGPKVTLESAIKEVPELRELIDADASVREVIDNARIIEGTVRHASTHAAGVVIAPGRTTDFIPVYKQGADDELYTQFDMHWVDATGLLKMDFLGLQTLQEIDLTLKALQAEGVSISLDELPLDDPKVFQLFGEGRTVGVFQFESSGMRDNLVKLKPERLEDLIAMNALYRPGPMQMIDEFINCRHGRKRANYIHPKLEPILKETYGVIVYQEQVIRIATELAGYSLGRADLFRRAMGKKMPEVMRAESVRFIEGCVERGVDRKSAEAIFSVIEQFAGYGFVKAHSAGYALIAYQCAYLKVHHPAHYLASSLTVRRRNPAMVLKLLAECRREGIAILQPDINDSHHGFTAVRSGIRFGLAAVRNVGDAAVQAILAARTEHGPFTSLHHFLTSVDLRCVNKKVVESLIDAGAFDAVGPNRATQMETLPAAVAYAQAIHEERLRGQTTLFGGVGVDPAVHIPPPEYRHVSPWPAQELQSREKTVLGYYVSSHPLDNFRRELSEIASHRFADKDEFKDGEQVKAGGVIVSAKFRQTRSGDKMAVLQVEDITGSMECLAFSSIIDASRHLLAQDCLVGLTGRISRSEAGDDPKLRVEEVIPLQRALEQWGQAVHLSLKSDEVKAPMIDKLEQLLQSSPGRCPVYIDLCQPNGSQQLLRLRRYAVLPARELIDRLSDIIGPGRVHVRC